jgi:hypothetical protein
MLDPLDVGRPVDRHGILRAGDHEPQVREAAGRLDQQPLQRRLAIVRVGAEVGQVPALRNVERLVGGGVDRAIKGARGGRAIVLLDPAERRTAGEG